MLLNERNIWMADAIPFEGSGLDVFAIYPGAWMMVYGEEALGPFDDATILRAVRFGLTPCVEGCEKGPSQLGVHVLSCGRRRLKRGNKWHRSAVGDLPSSRTTYDATGLEPLHGCCSDFSKLPKVLWSADDAWRMPAATGSDRKGVLAESWNAHPAGSMLTTAHALLATGFVVVDLP